MNENKIYYWNFNFKYLSLFACAFFYRLCIVLGSHLLFIRHHKRSGWPLGLKFLEGRNTLRVPEDLPPCVPGSTTISSWVNFHTPFSAELTWERQGQGCCACASILLGQMSWEPAWDVPTCPDPRGMCPCGGDPAQDVPAQLLCTHPTQEWPCAPKRASASTLEHSHSSSWPFLPVPSTRAFQLSQGPLLICREGQSYHSSTQDSLQESVCWVHWGWIWILAHIMVPELHQQPLAQRQPQLSLPFLSRKTSREISLTKCPNGVCRWVESLQALGMKFTKKWDISLEMCSFLQEQQPETITLLNVQCAGSFEPYS